jgi:hypothetical protein
MPNFFSCIFDAELDQMEHIKGLQIFMETFPAFTFIVMRMEIEENSRKKSKLLFLNGCF